MLWNFNISEHVLRDQIATVLQIYLMPQCLKKGRYSMVLNKVFVLVKYL